MSLTQSVSDSVNKMVKEMLSQVSKQFATRFKLDEKEVDEFLGKVNNKKEIFDTSPEKMIKYCKAELAAICKEKGLKVSGTKEELLNRIMGVEIEKKSTKKKLPEKEPEVIKKMTSSKSSTTIRRNAHGNYEHPETHLIFDPDRKVIGKQGSDGNVLPLSVEDVEQCKKFGFDYSLPENLDKNKKNLADVKVAEMNEEEIEEEEELDENDFEEEEEIEEDDE